MTLIVALKYDRGLVLAAERQVTYDESKIRTDIEKIERVEFQNLPVLVAVVHDIDNGFRFIDKFKRAAKQTAATSAEDIGLVAQRAMLELRDDIRRAHSDDKRTVNQIIEANNVCCYITIGVFINQEPHIIQLSLLKPQSAVSHGTYETDGCGASLADYFLAEYYNPGLDFEHAVITALYAMWIVTQHDAFCRGPISLSCAIGPGGLGDSKRPRVITFSPERIDDFLAIVKEIHSATHSARKEVIRAELERREAEYFRLIEEETKIWEASDLAKEAFEAQMRIREEEELNPPSNFTQEEWEERAE